MTIDFVTTVVTPALHRCASDECLRGSDLETSSPTPPDHDFVKPTAEAHQARPPTLRHSLSEILCKELIPKFSSEDEDWRLFGHLLDNNALVPMEVDLKFFFDDDDLIEASEAPEVTPDEPTSSASSPAQLVPVSEEENVLVIEAPRPPGAAPSGPRAPRPKNNAASSSNAAAAATTRHAVAVNPAEISLGGDAVRWGDLKREEDDLVEDDEPVSKRTRRHSNTSGSGAEEEYRKSRNTFERMLGGGGLDMDEQTSSLRRKRGRPSKNGNASSPTAGSLKSDSSGDEQEDAAAEEATMQAVVYPQGIDPNEYHCICRKKYDPSKFYVGCDLCYRWFHGKCVNIKQDQVESMDSWTCSDCLREAERVNQIERRELLCLCRQPYNEDQFYVGCDGCQGWFHPACVGITQEDVKDVAEYMCPTCLQQEQQQQQQEQQQQPDGYESASSSGSGGSEQDTLSRAHYAQIYKVVDSLLEHRMSAPFREPVDLSKYPDYLDSVKKPMDLKTIQQKVDHLEYQRLRHFCRDIYLMFENARTYNSKDSSIYQSATLLEAVFDQMLGELKATIVAGRQNRTVSESRTVDSSLDIDTDQLIDVDVDSSLFEQFL